MNQRPPQPTAEGRFVEAIESEGKVAPFMAATVLETTDSSYSEWTIRLSSTLLFRCGITPRLTAARFGTVGTENNVR